MGLTPTIREGSTEHDVLLRVKRRSHIGADATRRRALARLIEMGLVTAGSDNKLTPQGEVALRRIEQAGHYTPPLGHAAS